VYPAAGWVRERRERLEAPASVVMAWLGEVMEVSMASEADLKESRERLEEERRDLLDEIERLRTLLKTETDAATQEGDPDVWEHERTLAFLEVAQTRLEGVEQALKLLETGRYGTCQRCGAAIEKERLEALPDTALCLKCQREIERLSGRARR